jgi:CRP/FNR family cyclic AMP-dependent transcriptional regulator
MTPRLFNYDDPRADVHGDESIILGDLGEDDWQALLAYTERRKFPAGTEVLRAGEGDRTLYLIAAGSVDAVVHDAAGQQRVVAVIEEGSVFGELAFFDGVPRSATIRAREPIEVLALSFEAFQRLAVWQPKIAQTLLMDLGRILSTRLRRSMAG